MRFLALFHLYINIKLFLCLDNHDKIETLTEYSHSSEDLVTSILDEYNQFLEKLLKFRTDYNDLYEIYANYSKCRKSRSKNNKEMFDFNLNIRPLSKRTFNNFYNKFFIKAMQNETQYNLAKDYKYLDRKISDLRIFKVYPYKYLNNFCFDLPRGIWKVFNKKYLRNLNYIDANDINLKNALCNYHSVLLHIYQYIKNFELLFETKKNNVLTTNLLIKNLEKIINFTDIIFGKINLKELSNKDHAELFKVYVHIKLGINSFIILSKFLNSNVFENKTLKSCFEENDNCVLMLLLNYDYLKNL